MQHRAEKFTINDKNMTINAKWPVTEWVLKIPP